MVLQCREFLEGSLPRIHFKHLPTTGEDGDVNLAIETKEVRRGPTIIVE